MRKGQGREISSPVLVTEKKKDDDSPLSVSSVDARTRFFPKLAKEEGTKAAREKAKKKKKRKKQKKPIPLTTVLQKLPDQYEQLLAGQVTASEVHVDPTALKSVIAFVQGNFVSEGTAREEEMMPPAEKKKERGETNRRVVRQRPDPKKREVEPSEILELRDDESPLFSPENPKDLFTNFKKIGEGGVGTVYLALSHAGDKVALKNLDVSLEANLMTVEHEIRMMRSCAHQNIVKYHGSYIWEGQLWVCMEYMDGGSLTEMISICKMTEPQIAAVCRDVLQGLYYLHSFNRIHRDIVSKLFFFSRATDSSHPFKKTPQRNRTISCSQWTDILSWPTLATARSSRARIRNGTAWSERLTGWLPN